MQHSLSVKSSNSETIYRFAVTEISYGVYKKNHSTKDVSQSVAVRNPILLGHKVSFICY